MAMKVIKLMYILRKLISGSTPGVFTYLTTMHVLILNFINIQIILSVLLSKCQGGHIEEDSPIHTFADRSSLTKEYNIERRRSRHSTASCRRIR